MPSQKQEPYRFHCPTVADLPTVETLVRVAQEQEWLQVIVPTRITIASEQQWHSPEREAVQQLQKAVAASLPEHDVWDNSLRRLDTPRLLPRGEDRAVVVPGQCGFSIRRTLPEQDVLSHREAFLTAIAEYDTLATALMHRLAAQVDEDVSRFAASADWHDHRQVGVLMPVEPGNSADNWDYFFHGCDCAFRNVETGVAVEARLGFAAECGTHFGILDPGFFQTFLKTSATARNIYTELVYLLQGWWQDSYRALAVLESHGFLYRVVSADELAGGWFPVSQPSEPLVNRFKLVPFKEQPR